MAIDANIALGVQPFHVEDPLTAASKALQMQQAVNSSRLANLQIRSMQTQMDREDKLRSLLPSAVGPDGKPDYEKVAGIYNQVGMPLEGAKAAEAGLGIKQKQGEISDADIARHANAAGTLSNLLGQAKDAASYNAAIQAGMSDSNPLVVDATKQFAAQNPEFNPVAIGAAVNRTMSHKDQLEAEFKARGLDQTDKQITEAGRHNRAEEATAALAVSPVNKAAIAGAEAKAKLDATNGAIDPQAIEHWAQVVARGGTLPPGLARGDAGKALIIGVVKRAAQLGTPADYLANVAQQAGVRAGQVTLGERQANMGMATQEISAPGGLADVAIQASNNVPRGKWVPVNKVIQAVDGGESDPKLKAFAAANLGLASAYATAMSRGGVPSDAARNEALRILSTATGPQGYEAAVNQIRNEIHAMNIAPGAVRSELRQAGGASASIDGKPADGAAVLPPVNDKGWQLHEDAQGNKAYVGPKGEIEEVR